MFLDQLHHRAPTRGLAASIATVLPEPGCGLFRRMRAPGGCVDRRLRANACRAEGLWCTTHARAIGAASGAGRDKARTNHSRSCEAFRRERGAPHLLAAAPSAAGPEGPW